MEEPETSETLKRPGLGRRRGGGRRAGLTGGRRREREGRRGVVWSPDFDACCVATPSLSSSLLFRCFSVSD